jgi:hypothetical protein
MLRFHRAAALILIAAAATALSLVLAGCPSTPPLNSLTLLPSDACATSACMPPSPTGLPDACTVPSATFNTWFQPIAPATTGTPTLNGAVLPANSVSFPNTPNCSFYQWAQQDFLWLTSPTTAQYGGTGLILDSPAFFDVSPPDASGTRTLLAHTANFIRPFALRAAQVGPQGLQLIFDASGRPLQVKPAERGATPIVLDVSGQRVEVVHARLGKDGKPILLDKDGNVIHAQPSRGVKPEEQAQIATAQIPKLITAQKFIIDGFPIFIDPALAVIDVEQGQASFGGNGGVLEAQSTAGGSLVYFATIVNDVYAYYATGVLDGKISLPPLLAFGQAQGCPTSGSCQVCPPPGSAAGTTCFPTTSGDLTLITNFANGHTTFPDANALAIEVKSAWVDASTLPNASSYITMSATIPTYTHTSTTTWTANTGTAGQKTVQLALVGMHVVGSAAGHPEMIWATFEHVANAPRATYSYINNTGTSTAPVTATVTQNTATVPVIGGASVPWLFSATNATSFNNQNMSYNSSSTPPTIVANPPSTISPSNTIRWKAFGGASDIVPNPVDPSTAASNTELIGFNNSIRLPGMLVSGDVRGNYVMTGATWTVNGFPNQGFGESTASCANLNTLANGCAVGTSALSNTTMETYQQGTDPTLAHGGTNCLSCHTTNTTFVSHIFINQATGKAGLKALF